jgi:predicted nucleotidyltransferase
MNTYKEEFTQLQRSIFRLLCSHAGKKLNQRQIAKLLEVSPTAIANSLPPLVKKNLVSYEKEKEMNLISITLNRDNKLTMQLKRAENLKMVYDSGILELLEEEFPGSTIILFGSFSRGDDTITSDIDIAIINSKEKTIDLNKFEKYFEKKIILNFYGELNEVHKNLRENLCNGIVLSGGISL